MEIMTKRTRAGRGSVVRGDSTRNMHSIPDDWLRNRLMLGNSRCLTRGSPSVIRLRESRWPGRCLFQGGAKRRKGN